MLHRRALIASVTGATLVHLLNAQATGAGSPWDDLPSRAELLAMPRPGPDAPLPLSFAWKFVRLTPEEQDVIEAYLDAAPRLLKVAGAPKGMTMGEAIRAGLIVQEHRSNGDIIYRPA